MTNLNQDRYLSRVAAMQEMAKDSTIGGQQQVAQSQLQKQLEKHLEFGFKSQQAVLNALAGIDDETFTEADFEEYQIHEVKKGTAKWKTQLAYACAFKARCFPISFPQYLRIFGPKQRHDLVRWMFAQLKEDLQRGSLEAWNALSPEEQARTTKRRFRNSYQHTVTATMANAEFERFNQEAKESRRSTQYATTQESSGLSTTTSAKDLAYKSRSYASSICQFKTSNRRTSAGSSRQGSIAGDRDVSRYSNGRMTAGNKALTA